jgi:septal ring factor EnvC (AmiA/AmiB activator)
MLFSVENATITALVLIVAAVALRTITSAMLSGMKKSLDEIRQKLHAFKAELGFEAERRQSATDLLSFNERQKDDLLRRIEITKDDIEVLAAEFDEQPANKGESEGEGDERGDPKMPKHMRPRGEGFFD